MRKKIIIGSTIALVFISLITYGLYNFFYPGVRRDDSPLVAGEDKFVAAGKTTIAVMGVDEREEDSGRTDTLFVLMYNPETENLSMLSIPRDTRVRIPNHGWDKINHAYNYGGAKSTVSTLENFLGTHMDYYVKVNLEGFMHMVDALDGVEIEVEKRMYYEDPWDGDGLIIDLKPGLQTLNGRKAMEYVRYRDSEGDIGRLKRQQKFLNAVYDKLLSPSTLVKIPELVKVAIDSVETNMSISEMLKLANSVYKKSSSGFHAFSIPGEPVFINQINYWLPDIVAVRSEVAEVLGLEGTKDFTDSARTLAKVYKDSLPTDAARDGVIATDDKKDTKKDDKKTDNDKDDKKDDKTIDADTKDSKKDDKKTDSKDTQKAPDKDKAPKQVRVSVINCSGDSAAGKRIERILESQGVRVVALSEGKTPQQSTLVVASTHDGWVVSKLAGLPFRYSLKINKDPNARFEAVVYVGKDFL